MIRMVDELPQSFAADPRIAGAQYGSVLAVRADGAIDAADMAGLLTEQVSEDVFSVAMMSLGIVAKDLLCVGVERRAVESFLVAAMNAYREHFLGRCSGKAH